MPTKNVVAPYTWASYSDSSIDSFVALAGEPLIDRQNGDVKLRIGDGVTPGGQPVITLGLGGVSKPSIVTPTDGLNDVVLTPVISASVFNGLDGQGQPDSHSASHWQLRKQGDTDVIIDTGRNTELLEQLDIAALGLELDIWTGYEVRVRHEGATGTLSDWSDYSTFTTKQPKPDQEFHQFPNPIPDTNSHFGYSMAYSGDGKTLVVGAYHHNINPYDNVGTLVIYQLDDNNTWSEPTYLEYPGTPANNIQFGYNLSLSDDGRLLLVSSHHNSHDPYLFSYNPVSKSWEDTQTVLSYASGETRPPHFASNAQISGDGSTIALASEGGTVNGSNVYYSLSFYRGTPGNYTLLQTLRAPNDQGISYFGRHNQTLSISQNGQVVAVGAYNHNAGGDDLGQAYIFEQTSLNTWTHKQTITGHTSNDHLGYATAVSGDGSKVVVGTTTSSTTTGGYITVLEKRNNWQNTQPSIRYVDLKNSYPELASTNTSPYFGYSVALNDDGSVLLVGAYNWYSSAYSQEGIAVLFQWDNRVQEKRFIFQAKLHPSAPVSNQRFGIKTELSNDGQSAMISATHSNSNDAIYHFTS